MDKYFETKYENVTTWKIERKNGSILVVGLTLEGKYIITDSDNPFVHLSKKEIEKEKFYDAFFLACGMLGFNNLDIK